MFFLNFRRPEGDYPQFTKATALPQSGSANTGTKVGINQSCYLPKLGALVMFFLNFRRPEGDYPQFTKATAPTQSGSANTGTKAEFNLSNISGLDNRKMIGSKNSRLLFFVD